MPLYTYMVWFVLPIGALVSGAAAAAGYYWSARLINARPGRLVLLGTLVVSVATFFFLHYVEYRWTEYEGRAISSFVSFPAYVDAAVQSTAIETKAQDTVVRAWSTGELGPFGYLVALWQVIGFGVGGFFISQDLRAMPYCASCGRFSARTEIHRRSTHSWDLFSSTMELVHGRLTDGDIAGALREHARLGDLSFRDRLGNEFRSTVEVRSCPKCSQRWVRLTTQTGRGRGLKRTETTEVGRRVAGAA